MEALGTSQIFTQTMSVYSVVIKDDNAKVLVEDFETGKKKALNYKVVRPPGCGDAPAEYPFEVTEVN